jgi:hypothetical protein
MLETLETLTPVAILFGLLGWNLMISMVLESIEGARR